MASPLNNSARDPADFPNWDFPNLDIEYDPEAQAVWFLYKKDGPPYFSLQTLLDLGDVRESMRALFASGATEVWPVRYLLMGTNKPGVFNLGGDLAMFA